MAGLKTFALFLRLAGLVGYASLAAGEQTMVVGKPFPGVREIQPGQALPASIFNKVNAEAAIPATRLGKDRLIGQAWGDFDQDGWKDIFTASGHVYPETDRKDSGETYRQPRLLYWNRRDGEFFSLSE